MTIIDIKVLSGVRYTITEQLFFVFVVFFGFFFFKQKTAYELHR